MLRLYLAKVKGAIHIPSFKDPHPLVEAAFFAFCTCLDTSLFGPSVFHVIMASITETVVDSVKKLSLNGSAKQVNGDKIAIRNICCVGAGYVGMSPLLRACIS